MDYDLLDDDLDFVEDDDDLDFVDEDDALDFVEDDDDDFAEDDDDDDFAERRRRRRRPRRVRTARGRGLYRSRPSKKYATQAQLKASLSRVGGQIRRNAAAIKKVNSGLNSVRSTQARQNASLKRLRKDNVQLKKDIAELRQLSLLLPLLSDSDSEDSLLPMMLLGGLGGSDGGSDDNSLLMALAMSGSL